MKKLKERWQIKSNFQLAVIFVVFAITGSLSAYLSRFARDIFDIKKENVGHWYTPIRLILIFPIYQILLVIIGSIFGQFTFFWKFEKKMLRNLGLKFIPKDNF